MVERNAVGVDFPVAIADTRPCTPARRSEPWPTCVLEATGNTLSDDATVLCLDWHGGHGRDRDSEHGAEQARASEASTPS